MIIAIDGPSGTGKSTIAKKVAARLGFSFFDTGAMYRAFGFFLHRKGIDPADKEKVVQEIPNFHYEIGVDARGEKRYYVHGEDVTEAIRTQLVAQMASQIAIYPEVRSMMLEIQRNFARRGHSVFEGRDMGTVVFPNAELKIFLTALPEVRARRRYNELLCKFSELSGSLSMEQILKEIEERDQNDATREVAPLKQAEDAILIDTSSLSIDQVTNKILRLAEERRKFPPMRLSYKAIYWMARLFFRCCFRLKIYGLEHFQEGAAILASNHTSNYDPPVLSISCPEEVHFLAKESLFRVPLLGRLIRLLNSHPVSGTSGDAATFRQVISLLQSGKKVILFPEGTRSPTGELKALERGMAFIAYKAGCPILPAYIDGSFKAWPQGRRFPKLFGRMRVVFGKPIELDEFDGIDKREAERRLTEKTAAALRYLKKWLEDGADGVP